MDSQSFHDEFHALSALLESSEKAFVEKTDLGNDVTASRAPLSRACVQENIEKASFHQEDGRIIPHCDIIYQQKVETTDAFLGLTDKTPSSISCESLLIKIELPEVETPAEIQLECKENRILLHAKDYKLFHYLPHEVKYEQGKATWDDKLKVLTVTVPIKQKDLFKCL